MLGAALFVVGGAVEQSNRAEPAACDTLRVEIVGG